MTVQINSYFPATNGVVVLTKPTSGASQYVYGPFEGKDPIESVDLASTFAAKMGLVDFEITVLFEPEGAIEHAKSVDKFWEALDRRNRK